MDRTSDTSPADRQLVVFSMHGEQYGLPITSVREIIRYQRPRAIGAVDGLIQGVINLRNSVVPVCDLSSRLGEVLDIHDHSRILIIDTAAAAIGLIVDSVDEVMLVCGGQVEALPVTEGALGTQIAKVDERLIILIDAEHTFDGVISAETISGLEACDEVPVAS